MAKNNLAQLDSISTPYSSYARTAIGINCSSCVQNLSAKQFFLQRFNINVANSIIQYRFQHKLQHLIIGEISRNWSLHDIHNFEDYIVWKDFFTIDLKLCVECNQQKMLIKS